MSAKLPGTALIFVAVSLLMTSRAEADTVSDSPQPSGEPPIILVHPQSTVLLEDSTSPASQTTLQCHATGEPAPTYMWYRNGLWLSDLPSNLSSAEIYERNLPLFRDGAHIFQCVAENHHGRVLSKAAKLQAAGLSESTSQPSDTQYDVSQADGLKLTCPPADSAPPAERTWHQYQSDADEYVPVTLDGRIMMDEEGNLYFEHLLPSDVEEGNLYLMFEYNPLLDSHIMTCLSQINLSEDGVSSTSPPRLMYKSGGDVQVDESGQPLQHQESVVTAIAGENVTITCIFSGNPAVTITWSWGAIKTSRHNPVGHQLVISDVMEEDELTYSCTGSQRDVTDSATSSVNIQLVVGAGLELTQTKADSGDVTFQCTFEAFPEAELQWFINAYTLEQIISFPKWDKDGDGNATQADIIKVSFSTGGPYNDRAKDWNRSGQTHSVETVESLGPNFIRRDTSGLQIDYDWGSKIGIVFDTKDQNTLTIVSKHKVCRHFGLEPGDGLSVQCLARDTMVSDYFILDSDCPAGSDGLHDGVVHLGLVVAFGVIISATTTAMANNN